MNSYKEMINRQQKEFNEFPCFFAFSDEQFEEGMAKFGLTPDDTDKIYKSAAGMFYLRTDSPRLAEMFARHNNEAADAIAADLTGEGFILDMFYYELNNHEYTLTYDLNYTLDALGISWEDLKNNKRLKHSLELAKERLLEKEDAA